MRANPPPGYYPDPNGGKLPRWWDGAQWTDHTVQAHPSALTRISSALKSKSTSVPKVIVTPPTAPTLESALAECLLEPPRHPLDEQIEIVGEQFHAKGIRRVFADASMPITAGGVELAELQCILVPEPWNPHDRNAVAVVIGHHLVGYLPADLAARYSPLLGALASRKLLATAQARIWAKNEGGMTRARVTILAPEVEAFL